MNNKIKNKRIITFLLALVLLLGNFVIPMEKVDAADFPATINLNPYEFTNTPSYKIIKIGRNGGYGVWTALGNIEKTAERFTDGKNILLCIEVWNNIGYYGGSNPGALKYTANGSPVKLDQNLADFIQFMAYAYGFEEWEDFKNAYIKDEGTSNVMQLAIWQLLGQIEIVDTESYTYNLLKDFEKDLPKLKNKLSYDVSNHKWTAGTNVIKNTGKGGFSSRINPNPTFNATNGVTGKIALNGDLTINVPESALQKGFKFWFAHPFILNSTLQKQEYRNSGDGQRLVTINGSWDRWDNYSFNVEPQLLPLKLKKESTQPTYVQNNPNYSLQGAEYGLYASEVNAELNRNKLGTFITNANGETNTLEVPQGTYYVRETKAPKGYKINSKPERVEVKNQTNTFTVRDEPKTDPLSLMLKKTDENGKGLNDAIFEVKYYQEVTEKVEGLTPKYTWQFKTTSIPDVGDGIIKFHDQNKVSGDPLPKDENGSFVGYIGTYTFKEIKAPEGYILDDTLQIRNLTENGADNVLVYNVPTKENKEQLMKFTIKKEDVITTNGQGSGTLEGAKYNVVLIESKYTDTPVNTVVREVTTDENGIAYVDNLPLGTYDIVEVENSYGYQVNEVAVRVQGLEDDLGGEYTTKVIQTSTNSKILIDLINSKIDELNTINKANANGEEYREIPHFEEKEFNQVISDNPTIITNELVEMGRITIQKHLDGQNGVENSQNSGDREKESGIKFNILNQNGEIVDEITTDKNGRATSLWLPLGTYTIKQVTKVEGVQNVTDFEVTIEGKFTEYVYTLENYTNLKYLQIVKIDKETGEKIPQKGIAFELYDANKKLVTQKLTYPETVELKQFETNEKGMVQLPESIKVGTYYIREVKAPEGYYLDPNGEDIEIQINDDDITEVSIHVVENEPQKGKLVLNKTANQLIGTSVENGITKLIYEKGNLENTVWEIRAKEDIYSFDKVTLLFNQGDLVDTITTTKNGNDESIEMPLGKYTLQEISTGDKFVLDNNVYDIEFTPQTSEIRVDSQTVEKFNNRKQVEFTFDKVFEDSKYFTYEKSATFGLYLLDDYVENNVIIPKDSLIQTIEVNVTNNEINETLEKTVKGVFKDVEIDGRFYIKEIKTNDHYIIDNNIYPVEVTFDKDSDEITKIESATITNKLVEVKLELIKIETGSRNLDNNEAKYVPNAIYQLVAVDEIKGETIMGRFVTDKYGKLVIKGLTQGKYYLEEIQAPDGYIINKNKTIFEVKDDNDVKLELENEKRPEIKTKAKDKATGLQEVDPLKQVTIVDTVTYKDLIVGKEYTIKGYLMDKATNKEILNEKGERISSEVTFTAKERNGSIDLEFTINASQLRGKTIVVFESLYKDGIELTTHKDINDKDQSIEVRNPKIGTTATFENGKKEIVSNGKVKLFDKVEYKDLIVGKEYKLVGYVVLKENGKRITEFVELIFTPKEKNGFVEMEFEIDSDSFAGKELVVFEELYDLEGNLIAEHKDINDEGQTVKITEKPKTPKNPQTGDNGIIQYFYLTVISILVLFVSKKRKIAKE